jgi:CBS domain-containing protein
LENRIMKVSDILRVKGNTLYTITPEDSLADAARIMARRTSARWW